MRTIISIMNDSSDYHSCLRFDVLLSGTIINDITIKFTSSSRTHTK